uniref:Uncharacterized protein n=1 Tax=Chromera velia CCMP2878 TaxID=1169474 RepID=A0A0G4HQ03_9ALVE|eukprot:Cvel_30032.t1-p1 / transcript=Cvel_30032.t1 / gene=Cvel_30032 / organism=Chromera_velia_CCMP2878 / gene_product=hypothetical protein / transcript_product=hypothetical protein / location=Cvel_scaffold4220:140-2070(-) / protein_length=275 / sequence_SO=supercontig / SO=protein_coding / is_pseudo=false
MNRHLECLAGQFLLLPLSLLAALPEQVYNPALTAFPFPLYLPYCGPGIVNAGAHRLWTNHGLMIPFIEGCIWHWWEKENRLKAEICEYVLPKSLEYIWLRWKQATGDSVLCRIQRKDDRIWGISLQAARAIAIAGMPFLSKVVLNKEEWRTVYDVEGSERDFNCFVDGVAGYCKTWGCDKEKKWLSCSVIATVKERKQAVSAEEKANALKELLLAQQGMQQRLLPDIPRRACRERLNVWLLGSIRRRAGSLNRITWQQRLLFQFSLTMRLLPPPL